MAPTSAQPQRRSTRLQGYDYASSGYYFVTLCTEGRRCVFGDVEDDTMVFTELGRIADEEWLASAGLRREVELDEYVVMPNHLHGLVLFKPQVPRPEGEPTTTGRQRPKRSLGSFMAGYKATVTGRVNRLRSTPGERLWQRNYWDHVVRSERALDAIRRYIDKNPARWSLDRYHPNPLGTDPLAAEAWRLLKESV